MVIQCDKLRLSMPTLPPPDPAERVRQRLKQWIDTTKIGQREMAADLGKTQVWLQKVLTGENHARLRDLDNIARALRTTASELVRGEEDRRQYELTPSEVKIIERMRHRQAVLFAIVTILGFDEDEFKIANPPQPLPVKKTPRKKA